jgi:hypothetical protein
MIKEILKGRHFDDTDDMRSNTTAALKAIASQGVYFEGDHSDIQQGGM